MANGNERMANGNQRKRTIFRENLAARGGTRRTSDQGAAGGGWGARQRAFRVNQRTANGNQRTTNGSERTANGQRTETNHFLRKVVAPGRQGRGTGYRSLSQMTPTRGVGG